MPDVDIVLNVGEHHMVRTDLVRIIAAQYPDLPAGDIEAIVATFFGAITTRLADGGRVELRGFGSFSTRVRDARPGRNPRTGETVALSDRRVPWFKAGKDLCELINGIDQHEPGKKVMAGNVATETQPVPNISTELQNEGDARSPSDAFDRGQ